jgi:flagellar motor component MotA
MGGICLVFIVVLFIGMRGFSETKQDHIQTQKINESLQLAVDKENDKKKIEEIATKEMEENEQW